MGAKALFYFGSFLRQTTIKNVKIGGIIQQRCIFKIWTCRGE